MDLGQSTTASSFASLGTLQPSTPLAIITETAHQQIVRDIAAVVRRELGATLPRHLTPVLSALEEVRQMQQNKQRSPPIEEKSRGGDRLNNSSSLPSNAWQTDPQQLPSRTLCTPSPAQEADGEDGQVYHEPSTSWRMGLLSGRERKEGYQLLQTKDDDEVNVICGDEGEDEFQGMADPEAAKRLPRQIFEMQAKRDSATQKLADLDTHWNSRRAPYEDDVKSFTTSIAHMEEELLEAQKPKMLYKPPGPKFMRFVDGTVYTATCNLVVVLNLTCIGLTPHLMKFETGTRVVHWLDQIFLIWYVTELVVKAVYHQSWFFCGECSTVWWNWLDICIVACGIVDQWLLPLYAVLSGNDHHVNASALMLLRTLRLFRVIRIMKVFRSFLQSNLDWTEGAYFESFMSGVIAANSVIMSLEVDIEWAGWVYVENFLQIVYTFELALRLKKYGCKFFTSCESWNYLDFVMVICGAMDLWLIPLVHFLQDLLNGDEELKQNSTLKGVFKVLTLMRLVRVLRLVKLLKMVKPLYRLLLGVMESVRAMQWVIVLTFLTLYACAVVFTNLVGKGLVTDGEISPGALKYFGSVPRSLFSLFKLMNGDLDVVEPIANYVSGQLLFAGFMVVTNWAVLAILTSVVSDNMISTSQKANEEDERKIQDELHELRTRRLKLLFHEIDQDGDACITSSEWRFILKDPGLRNELLQATGLDEQDINQYFDCLSEDAQQMVQARAIQQSVSEKQLDYNMFIEALKDDGEMADKRSVLKVTSQLRRLENRLEIALRTSSMS